MKVHMCSLNHCSRCGNCTNNPGWCDECRRRDFPYEFVRLEEFKRLERKVDLILAELSKGEK